MALNIMLNSFGVRTLHCLTALRGVSSVQYSSRHAVVELMHHTDELIWTAKLCHDLPQSLATNSVKGLCQVYKRYVEVSVLFLTLFLELPCSKHHVSSSTAFPEATLTF